MTDFERFHAACLEALAFTDTGADTDIPADAELADETAEWLRADCLSFWRRFGCYIGAADMSPEHAGHDFWLTRNGHGAGFWDGDWPEPYASILDKGARCCGGFRTYLGDNGLIYAMPE